MDAIAPAHEARDGEPLSLALEVGGGEDRFPSRPGGLAQECLWRPRGHEPSPTHNGNLVVNFKTNNAAAENWYEVLDADGKQVRMRSGFLNNTINKDTLNLDPGCYEFILHDTGDDGISFWANNDGSGTLNFLLVGGSLWQSLMTDFGKEIRYSFRIAGTNAVAAFPEPVLFEVYPNPTRRTLSVALELAAHASVYLELRDMLGRVAHATHVQVDESGRQDISFPVDGVAPGGYQLTVYRDGHGIQTANVRIVR